MSLIKMMLVMVSVAAISKTFGLLRFLLRLIIRLDVGVLVVLIAMQLGVLRCFLPWSSRRVLREKLDDFRWAACRRDGEGGAIEGPYISETGLAQAHRLVQHRVELRRE